jgi:hypothetical protein
MLHMSHVHLLITDVNLFYYGYVIFSQFKVYADAALILMLRRRYNNFSKNDLECVKTRILPLLVPVTPNVYGINPRLF